jgi:hypothetical protein
MRSISRSQGTQATPTRCGDRGLQSAMTGHRFTFQVVARRCVLMVLVAGVVGTAPGGTTLALEETRLATEAEDPGTAGDPGHTDCGTAADGAPTASSRAAGMVVTASPVAGGIDRLRPAYALRVYLRYAPARLVTREIILVCNRSAATVDTAHLSVLAHAFRELRIRDVRVDGQRVRASFPNRGDMDVPLPGGLQAGQRARIEVRFVDQPSAKVDSSLEASLSIGEHLVRVSDWFPLVSDGHGLRYPGDSQVSPAATRIRLDVRSDRRLVVAGPGRPVVSRPTDHAFLIKNARDVVFLAAPGLREVTSKAAHGVLVSAYARRRGDARRVAHIAAQALDAYTDAYGPYPWRRLVLAPTPRRSSGHEYPGFIFLGTAWIEGHHPWEWRQLLRGMPHRWMTEEYVVTHEVAHQWFYALVGSDQLREPWLDEALAEFSAHHFFRPAALSTCSDRRVSLSVYDFRDRPTAPGCTGYAETVYRRGAVMIDGVRQRLGDEAFFAAMREYVAEERFRVATSRDLIAAWMRHASAPGPLCDYLARFLGPQEVAFARPTSGGQAETAYAPAGLRAR